MRRAIWMGCVLAAAGCQTVEVKVDYLLSGVHVAAKFEARDPQPPVAMADTTSAPEQVARVPDNTLL